MPARCGRRFELALGGGTAPNERLQALGWRLRNPLELTCDPWVYQDFMRASKAEFSVAKQGYVASRSGWFSERSAGYLAVGRPVVVQDTGFSRHLPTGDGLLAFSDLDEAVAAVSEVDRRYAYHCAAARRIVEEKGLDLRYYSIIYEIIDDVKKALSGLLSPEVKEQIIGLAEVRDVFRSAKLGAIAGCMVVDGVVKRNNPIRVLRENVVIYEGSLESLRRFKDDVAEVKAGMECGIGVKNYNDVRVGDHIEVFERVEIARQV
jgi:hypothetical protein